MQKTWDGKLYVEPKKPEYIYQGTTKTGEIISLPNEQDTINALHNAGGGFYENILYGFGFKVD